MKQSGIVWFNVEPHSLSRIDEGMGVIMGAGDEKLSLISSGPRGCVPVNSDRHVIEPLETQAMTDREYLEWCLHFALQNGVGLFVPSRGSIEAARMKNRFLTAGIKVMVPGSEEVMRVIQHKSWLYERLADSECAYGYIPIPAWRVVNTLEEMKAAYTELRARHPSICFKPDAGIFGYGFRRIVESGTALDRLMKGGPYTATSEIGWAEIETIFGNAGRFDDLLMMPYLPGRERSVDCIAHEGRLVACINRFKATHESQVMEKNERIEEFIQLICAQLHLSGVFNVQFRDGEDEPFLLEINSRMSGGLHKACKAASFALPYWAVLVALGLTSPEDVPQPRTGSMIVKRKIYDILN